MKAFYHFFGGCLLVAFLLSKATAALSMPAPMEGKAVAMSDDYSQHIDSVIDVSLITCQPSANEIYSLYGHTAIRFVNREMGIDLAANWGIFSMNQRGFLWRFLMGTALYTMELQPYDAFCRLYANEHRGIIEQHLNLTPQEKLSFAEALQVNNLPLNRDYPYDFLFDNCSTRARNILLKCINGQVQYKDGPDASHHSPLTTHPSPLTTHHMSFRQLIHLYTDGHPWAQFGNDMLMGVTADRKASPTEAQFLPELLMKDFSHATVQDNGGAMRPLVKEAKGVVPYFQQTVDEGFPLPPRSCFLIFLALTIAITLVELYARKHFWLYDALLMLACSLGGMLLFVMVFSKHPTVSLNLQLLLFNPLPLFFIWRMIRRSRSHRRDRQYAFWIILICLFFVGNLFQHYAEGMNLVAASLLLRNVRLRYARSSRLAPPATLHAHSH